VLIKKKLALRIPAGVDTGSRLRLHGEGEQGDPGAPAGDLYVFIHVEPHETFRRQNDDLIVGVPITYSLAALGGEIDTYPRWARIFKFLQEHSQDRISGYRAKAFLISEGGAVGILLLWYT
jgi:molecular chaperone DnaJ